MPIAQFSLTLNGPFGLHADLGVDLSSVKPFESVFASSSALVMK